jgi:hypothetical protein
MPRNSLVRELFTRPARREPVVATKLPAAPVVAAPVARVGVGGVSTRQHCACGHSYGSSPEVWQELRGGHLRCFCGGCAS